MIDGGAPGVARVLYNANQAIERSRPRPDRTSLGRDIADASLVPPVMGSRDPHFSPSPGEGGEGSSLTRPPFRTKSPGGNGGHVLGGHHFSQSLPQGDGSSPTGVTPFLTKAPGGRRNFAMSPGGAPQPVIT